MNKTIPNRKSVRAFIQRVEDPTRREDCFALIDLMQEVTAETPKMWGDSIVGFGSYHYRYDSGREGDFLVTGFSPRKGNLTVYVMQGFKPYSELLEVLGKHKTSVSCLYIKRLADIDLKVLKKIIRGSVKYIRSKYD